MGSSPNPIPKSPDVRTVGDLLKHCNSFPDGESHGVLSICNDVKGESNIQAFMWLDKRAARETGRNISRSFLLRLIAEVADLVEQQPGPKQYGMPTTNRMSLAAFVAALKGEGPLQPPEQSTKPKGTAGQDPLNPNATLQKSQPETQDTEPAGGEVNPNGTTKKATASKKRGRPIDTNPEDDRQLFDAWSTGLHTTYDDLAKAKGNLTRDQVARAIDRHRQRIKRN